MVRFQITIWNLREALRTKPSKAFQPIAPLSSLSRPPSLKKPSLKSPSGQSFQANQSGALCPSSSSQLLNQAGAKSHAPQGLPDGLPLVGFQVNAVYQESF
jgi:hypothetical protein